MPLQTERAEGMETLEPARGRPADRASEWDFPFPTLPHLVVFYIKWVSDADPRSLAVKPSEHVVAKRYL